MLGRPMSVIDPVPDPRRQLRPSLPWRASSRPSARPSAPTRSSTSGRCARTSSATRPPASTATWRSARTVRTAASPRRSASPSSTSSCAIAAPVSSSWPAPRTTASDRPRRSSSAAADLGADYGLVLAPGYFRRQMTVEVLYRYFSTLADTSPLPILLYNAPGFNGLALAPELVGRLAAHPRIVGMKDSAAVGHRGLPGASARPGFAVLAGSANFLLAGHAGRLARRDGLAGELVPGGRPAPVPATGVAADRDRRPALPGARDPRQRRHLRRLRGPRREGRHGPGRLRGRPAAPAPAAARREPQRAELRAVLETEGLLP